MSTKYYNGETRVSKTVEQQVALSTGMALSDDDAKAMFYSLIGQLFAPAAPEISPWWSRQRDVELRAFWQDGQQASGIMYRAQNKIASIPFKVEARDKSISAHVKQAQSIHERITQNSGFMEGFNSVMLKFVQDYLSQDNGAFIQLLGDGNPVGPIEGPVFGLRHLDAARCQRTGHPVYPVVYMGDDGRRYKFHQARILHIAQMPSPRAEMFGVGYCSISRSYRILENLQHIVNYKDEKMGAKAAAKLLVGTGITGLDIIKAMAASEAMMESLGIKNLMKTTAVGSTTGEMKIDAVDLNTLDPFDESATFTFASYALALAWGLEFNELIPLETGRMSDIASLQRARSMLPQSYKDAMEQQMNIKLVPPHLKVSFDYQDDLSDQQRAIIEDITSRNYSRQIDSGYTTPLVVQENLCERGYVSEAQLNNMKLNKGLLPDNSPVQTVFFDSGYSEFVLIDNAMLNTLTWGEPEMALALIEANKTFIYDLMGQRRSSIFRDKASHVLAALEWLEEKYALRLFRRNEERLQAGDSGAPAGDDQEEDRGPQGEDQGTASGSSAQDGRLSNSDTGEKEGVAKSAGFFPLTTYLKAYSNNYLLEETT